MPQVKVPVWCVGISHRTAPVELIERLSIDAADLTSGFARLRARFARHFPERELVLVSTCNRIELYWSHGVLTYDGDGGCPYEGFTSEELDEIFSIPEGVGSPVYQLRGAEACRHLFEVACGLDSLVVGEHQILGQLTEALSAAHEAQSDGPVMRALFTSAIRAGRRARSETAIARNASSVSSVAVELAVSLLGSLESKRVVVAGAGEMGRLAIEALHGCGAIGISVVNRTMASAREAVAATGGNAHPLEELPSLLESADILLSSTGARRPILDLEAAERVMAARGGRSLLIIDIALPRDIAPEVGRIPGVHLYDMEALKGLVDRTAELRLKEIPRVQAIIAEELSGLVRQIGELSVHPLLAGLWNRANGIRSALLESARSTIPGLDEAEWRKVEELSELLVKKLLHDPTTRLREAAARDGAPEHARSLAFLFGLDGFAVDEETLERGEVDGRALDGVATESRAKDGVE